MLDLPVCIFPNNGSSAYNLAGDLTAAGARPSARLAGRWARLGPAVR